MAQRNEFFVPMDEFDDLLEESFLGVIDGAGIGIGASPQEDSPWIGLPSFCLEIPSDSHQPRQTSDPTSERAQSTSMAAPFGEHVFTIGGGNMSSQPESHPQVFFSHDANDFPPLSLAPPPRSYLSAAASGTKPKPTTTTIPSFPSLSPAALAERLCQFHVSGKCRYGDHCRNIHGERCPLCERNCIHPFLTEPENHVGPCLERHIVERSNQSECNICFENTIQLGRKFGLLNSCNHVFCLECIRNWRSSIDRPREVVRACPICRTESHFVIPCDYVPDEEEKAAITESYQRKLTNIPCKYFKASEGDSSCPFGNSCFYAHLNDRGERIKEVPRKYVNSDGDVDIIKAVRLSEFIK